MTQPAEIRLVRDADNPWYEVMLTEGRNREIRKMFEEIGHFVEKIRRVGYGPLVLDVAPGEMRELSEAEVLSLQRSSVGVRGKRAASAEDSEDADDVEAIGHAPHSTTTKGSRAQEDASAKCALGCSHLEWCTGHPMHRRRRQWKKRRLEQAVSGEWKSRSGEFPA